MKIKSEHNGIKFSEKCWVWGCNELNGSERFFLGYVKGASFPVKVIDEEGAITGFKNARPLKTEAEKVLEAPSMKIIQFVIGPSNQQYQDRIFGLGDDGVVYFSDQDEHGTCWAVWIELRVKGEAQA
tara:strand:+ start:366 stop:746 length:381 start_codon:yes stop_codon:yes gene_type:complete